jgi:hypothetical protein
MRATVPLLLALASCDDAVFPDTSCSPAFVRVGSDCVFDEGAVQELIQSFEQGRFEEINAAPFVQIYGDAIERNVWVTRTPLGDGTTAADLYRSIDPARGDQVLDRAFPVGTVIVHEAVNREQGHGVQVRREDGFVADDGGAWWDGKLFDDGTFDENPCNPCSDCHSPDARPGTEGLVGVTREAM